MLVIVIFNVTCLPLRPHCEKTCTCFYVRLRALMQSDCLLYRCSSLFFEHYKRILRCDWVPVGYTVSLRMCAGRNAFVLHQALAKCCTLFRNMRLSCPTLDLAMCHVLRVSKQLCWGSVCNVMLYEVLHVSKQVPAILWSCHQRCYKTFCVCSHQPVLCRYCVLVPYALKKH